MKRFGLCIPLLCLAPLGDFLGEYLEGAGVIPEGVGLMTSTACMFLLPWVVSGLFAAAIPKLKLSIRIGLFVFALLVQAALFADVVPPGATSQMMGAAHRLRRQFAPEVLCECANHIRQKHREGTLTLADRGRNDYVPMSEGSLAVSDSELPVSLRGHFQRVFIEPSLTAGDEQVFFALDTRMGIVCDSRKKVREFFVCSMSEGVHAYRYQRL